MHYCILVIVPAEVADWDLETATRYVQRILAPYEEDTQVPEYVVGTREELERYHQEIKECVRDQRTFEHFLDQHFRARINAAGEIVSTTRPGMYDHFALGHHGRFVEKFIPCSMLVRDDVSCTLFPEFVERCKLPIIDEDGELRGFGPHVVHDIGEFNQAEFDEVVDRNIDKFVAVINCHY